MFTFSLTSLGIGLRVLFKIDEVIRGGVSDKVLQIARENTVWLVR